MKIRRTHPYTLIEFLSRFLFVLIVPLVQQILYMYTDIFNLTSAVTLNLLILFTILSYCLFKYNFKKYCYSRKLVYLEKGIFRKAYVEVLCKKISTITLKYNVFPSLFGSNKVIINTLHAKKDSKIELNLSKKKLIDLLNKVFPKREVLYVYKASLAKIVLMATSWSNPAKGLIIIAPFINTLGKILGQEIKDKLYYTLDIGVNLITNIIPPVFATITYGLLIGWLIAMLFIISQYANLKTIRTKDCIIISKGLISSTQKIINFKSINSISIRQTILMKVLRLYSAYVSVASKDKNEQNLLIAACNSKKLYYNLIKILQADINVKVEEGAKPPKRTLKGFVLPPLICICCLVILYYYIPYTDFNFLFALFLGLILIYWLIIRIEGYKCTHLLEKDNEIFISGYKGFTLQSNIVPKDKVQYIKISVNPLQRFSKLSTVRIYIKSDKKEFYKAKQLELEYVENFVEKFENS